jgi:hypothetical protein
MSALHGAGILFSMIYLILWLLCGIAAAAIYRDKNRSGLVGLFVGVIFGPIGLILALLTPRVPVPSASKICPKCGTSAAWTARVCPKCGADIRYS